MIHLIAIIEKLDDSYGGPSVSLPELLFHLQNYEDMKVTILSGLKKDEVFNNQTLEKKHVDINFFDVTGPEKLKFSSNFEEKLHSIIKAEGSRPVLYVNNLWNFVAYKSWRYSVKHNLPMVVATRGSLFPWSLSQRFLIKKLAWHLFQEDMLNNCDFIHATSEQEKNAIINLNIKSDVLVSPHGISVPDKPKYDKTYYKKKSFLNPGFKYFLFCSRLHKKKGLEILIDVWKSIYRDHPNWKLIIAGPDPYGYKKLIEKAGLSDFVIQLPLITGLKKEYVFRACSFFVLPSLSENFGVVIAEALSYELPVITTNNTPWQDINSVDCGLCINLTPDNLKSAVERYLSLDCMNLSKQGKKGREHVEKNYSWPIRVRNFKKLLLEKIDD